MIRRLRTAHRFIFVIAAVVLPAILVTGLLARRPLPLAAPPEGSRATTISATHDWATTVGTVKLSLARITGDSTHLAVRLSGVAALRAPDLLLYWTGRPLPIAEIRPTDALLGPVSGEPIRVFALPPAAPSGQGSLLLYSLGHRALVGVAPVPNDKISTQ
ncbi:MAG: hypothetical protein ABJC74_08550 [Gemmatimonadota bacterium]